MADQLNGTVIGAVGTVCTVLLSAAGVNLRQLAQHNARLVGQLEQRNKDVDQLNQRFLEAAQTSGKQILELTKELASVQQVAADAQRLQMEAKTDEDLILELKIAVEKLTLEKMGLRQKLHESEEREREKARKKP